MVMLMTTTMTMMMTVMMTTMTTMTMMEVAWSRNRAELAQQSVVAKAKATLQDLKDERLKKERAKTAITPEQGAKTPMTPEKGGPASRKGSGGAASRDRAERDRTTSPSSYYSGRGHRTRTPSRDSYDSGSDESEPRHQEPGC